MPKRNTVKRLTITLVFVYGFAKILQKGLKLQIFHKMYRKALFIIIGFVLPVWIWKTKCLCIGTL